jgi:hypothetical protein
MEHWRVDAPKVDLASFPITAEHERQGDEGDHTARERAICVGIARAIGLPAGVKLSGHAAYASIDYCSAGGPDATSYRLRVNGFGFGEGSKKDTEYLAVTVLGLRGDDIVAWSEDVQRLGDGAKDWEAFRAGKWPGRSSPPPKKGNPKAFARLTFVDAKDQPLPITKELRALVAKIAAPAPAEAPAKPGATATKAPPKPKKKTPAKPKKSAKKGRG